MKIAVGLVLVAIGLALVLNVRGFAVWGSGDSNNMRDSSGRVKQRQPVWITRVVGALAVIMGVYTIVA